MGLKKFHSICTALVALSLGLPCTIKKLCKKRKGRKVAPQPGVDHEDHSTRSFPISFSSPEEKLTKKATYKVSDFEPVKVLGRGSYAKVFLAREKDTGKHYAMKVLKKEEVLKRGTVEDAHAEKRILFLASSFPYLSTLHSTFSSPSHLYYVMEYLSGGTLSYHLSISHKFDLNRARFYAAEISSGLQFLHGHGIIHRDVKPANILLDREGHCRLTDFGLSCEGVVPGTTIAFGRVGTHSYMSPEIALDQDYLFEVDWWSFGVLCYEMITGMLPFRGKTLQQLVNEIIQGNVRFPLHTDATVIQFLSHLLHTNPKRRLGCMEGVSPIRSHPFFKGIDWDSLDRRELVPPFIPDVQSDGDTKNFNAQNIPKQVISSTNERKLDILDDIEFSGFTFAHPYLGKDVKRMVERCIHGRFRGEKGELCFIMAHSG